MGVLWEDEAWQEQDKKTLIFKFLNYNTQTSHTAWCVEP